MSSQPPASGQGQNSFPSKSPNPLPRRRGTACNRCRLQKIRCNNQQPVCSSCMKAGAECIKSSATDVESRNYIKHLEKRTQWLEEELRKVTSNVTAAGQEQKNSEFDPGTYQISENIPANTHQQPSNTTTQGVEDHTLGLYQNFGPAEPAPLVTAASTAAESPAGSVSSQIGPSQPLAHDVGLLSLANSTDPKYLGPSSGVTFARLIFAAAPQSQGLPSSWLAAGKGSLLNTGLDSETPALLAELPAEDELHYFIDAYFELWQPLYPFLDEDSFQDLIRTVYLRKSTPQSQSMLTQEALSDSTDLAQLFLVLALGARILESRLSTEFSSDQFYATAMLHIRKISLHDSARGVQILLLLVLSSFSFTNGLNAWFLTSTIIASCLDLGLQRKHLEGEHILVDMSGPHRDFLFVSLQYIVGLGNSQKPTSNGISGRRHIHSSVESDEALRIQTLRSGIFWSAYSLDRTLSVILGRPLTLRDEALDIEYPGQCESQEIDYDAVNHRGLNSVAPNAQASQNKRIPPFVSAIYLFRLDRITAEIKLMIYRVAQSPGRFPWPINLIEWQKDAFEACGKVLQGARHDLKWRGSAGSRGLPDRMINTIELKYHQCVMLLYRPSPAFPQPSLPALKVCYDSAVETIRIHSELNRFANMINSWLTAHAVFVSGITMLYCLWISPQIRRETNPQAFMQKADSCTKLLITLGKTWSVAQNCRPKFDRLVQLTVDSWNKTQTGITKPANYVRHQEMDNNMETVRSDNTGEFSRLENPPQKFWDEYDTDYWNSPNMIMDELGDMGNWFDLDWLSDANRKAFQADAWNVGEQ